MLTLHCLRYTHTHTTVLLLIWNMSGSTRVSRYQKGKTKKVKTNLDLLEQEIVSASGICWAMSAPHADNHANIPPLCFLQAGCPSWRPTNSVKALSEIVQCYYQWDCLQGILLVLHLLSDQLFVFPMNFVDQGEIWHRIPSFMCKIPTMFVAVVLF